MLAHSYLLKLEDIGYQLYYCSGNVKCETHVMSEKGLCSL